MRALLRPLSTHTVYSPIECIVTVFVLATLAYFHILSGIKHSSFFEATQPPALRPAYARLTDGEWVAVTKHDWADAWKRAGDGVKALELQQLVFSLDDKARTVRVISYHFITAPSSRPCWPISVVALHQTYMQRCAFADDMLIGYPS